MQCRNIRTNILSTENHPPIAYTLSLLISMQNKTSVFRYVSSAFIFAMFYGVSLITSLFSCSSTSNGESGDVARFGDISTKMLRMSSLPVHSCHKHAFYVFSFTLYFTTSIYDYTRVRLSALDSKFISSICMTSLKTILCGILLWQLHEIELRPSGYIFHPFTFHVS
jgi:hypothetical protein